jgi:hypothetical protein
MVAWASTLPTGQAEADDDFFAVGGNSLLAVQLVAQVLRAGPEPNWRDPRQMLSVVHGIGVAGVRRVTLLRRQPKLLDWAVEKILRVPSDQRRSVRLPDP